MEAEKFHNLLSAHWRPRKIADAVGRPKSWEADVVDSSLGLRSWEQQVLRAGQDQHLSSSQPGGEQIQPSSTFLFHSGPWWIGWCPPTLKRATCCALSTSSNASLFCKHCHRHTQLSGRPLAKSRWDVKFTSPQVYSSFPGHRAGISYYFSIR